jgi:hypothetical protein
MGIPRADFQHHCFEPGTLTVAVPLSRGFIADLRKKGFLRDAVAHDKDAIGKALAHAAQVAIKMTRDRDDDA